MKKSVLLFCFVLAVMAAQAQVIPNGTFEAWGSGNPGTQEPTSWSTVNPFVNSALGVGVVDSGTVFKEITVVHLLTSAKLITKTYSGSTGLTMGAVPGVMACGASTVTATGIPPSVTFHFSPGMAFTSRPDSIQGYLTYLPQGGDTMTIGVILSKWNAGLNKRDTIGYTTIKKTGTVGGATMVYFSDTITYMSSAASDSLTLWVQGGQYPGGHAGTTLYVDDISFKGTDPNGAHVGIAEKAEHAAMSLYPNPANQNVYVSIPAYKENSNSTFVVSNILGQEVFSTKVTSSKMKFSVADLQNGLYIYRLVSADGSEQAAGRLVVSK